MEKRIMKTLSVFLCAMVLLLGFVGTSNAFLYDRGNGLIYDSDQNITWLQDANYAQTSGYDDSLYGYNTNGVMYWNDAVAWLTSWGMVAMMTGDCPQPWTEHVYMAMTGQLPQGIT
jgi:hypothetical protein